MMHCFPDDLSDGNFEKVYSTVLDIADILHLRPDDEIELPLQFSHCIESTLNLNPRQNRIMSDGILADKC